MISHPFRVAVVGCGVGGATTALLLARAGHSVDVFERAPVLGPVGAGILLQPSGQEVLRRLDLLPSILARAEPIDTLHAFQASGQLLIRINWSDAGPGLRAYGLHRGDLFNVLHQAVLRQGVRIHTRREILSVRHTPQASYLSDTSGREEGPFDFIVAADGSRSQLRGSCTLRKWVHEYEYGAAWAIGESEQVRGCLHQVVRGTHDLVGLLPMGEGRCSLFWSLRRADKDATWQGGFDAWRNSVVRLCPQADNLLGSLAGFEQVAYTTYCHVWMPRTYDARVVFLGDAAHAMSPHLGQGVNLALVDAFSFARALSETGNFRHACVAHRDARRAHLRYYSLVTMGLTPFFQSRGVVKGWWRDGVLTWMTRIPWLRRQMALTMAGIKGDFFRSSWTL